MGKKFFFVRMKFIKHEQENFFVRMKLKFRVYENMKLKSVGRIPSGMRGFVGNVNATKLYSLPGIIADDLFCQFIVCNILTTLQKNNAIAYIPRAWTAKRRSGPAVNGNLLAGFQSGWNYFCLEFLVLCSSKKNIKKSIISTPRQ